MQVPTQILKKELEWAQRFIDKASPIPILNDILFEVDGPRLTLTGTDLEIGGITEVLIERNKAQKKERICIVSVQHP